MKRVQDIAELLVASWILSQEGDQLDPLPPSTFGILDRAIDSALKEGAFPKDWTKRLHFISSLTGIQCVELDEVIGAAQRAEFTQEPNSSYKATRIKIGPYAARVLVRRHSLDEAEVQRWGKILRKSVKAAQNEMKDYIVAT